MTRQWDSIREQQYQARRRQFGEYLTREQLLVLSGASPRVLRRLAALDLVHRIWIGGQALYPIELLPRVRKMLRLRYDLGVSWTSMELVLRLLDRVDELEALRKQTLNPKETDHVEDP